MPLPHLPPLEPDVARLIGLLLLSIPLALLLSFIPSRSRPALFSLSSLALSAWYVVGVFGHPAAAAQLLFDALAVYALLASSLSASPRLPWLVLMGLLAHLSWSHARRLFTAEASLDAFDVSGPQMVLVIKLSSFAWSLHDARSHPALLDANQRAHAIKQLPPLLDFLGYCFFFPSLLVGPAMPFNQYRAFLYRLHPSPPLRHRILAGLKRTAIGIGCGVLFGVWGSAWGYTAIIQHPSRSFFQKLWHLQVAGFMSRSKYYFAWSLAEAALTMIGYGFDEASQEWTGGRNLEIKQIELAQNYKTIFDNWNIKTNIWLRESVYKRVGSRSSQPAKPGFKTLMITFATSALWHGPLPAYFLAFLSAGLLQALGRSIRTTIRPFFLNKTPGVKAFYDLACLVMTQASLNYLVVPFVLLDIRSTVEIYSQLAWYGHVIALVPMLLLWWPVGLERRLKKSTRHHSSAPQNTSHSLKKLEVASPVAVTATGISPTKLKQRVDLVVGSPFVSFTASVDQPRADR